MSNKDPISDEVPRSRLGRQGLDNAFCLRRKRLRPLFLPALLVEPLSLFFVECLDSILVGEALVSGFLHRRDPLIEHRLEAANRLHLERLEVFCL